MHGSCGAAVPVSRGGLLILGLMERAVVARCCLVKWHTLCGAAASVSRGGLLILGLMKRAVVARCSNYLSLYAGMRISHLIVYSKELRWNSHSTKTDCLVTRRFETTLGQSRPWKGRTGSNQTVNSMRQQLFGKLCFGGSVCLFCLGSCALRFLLPL